MRIRPYPPSLRRRAASNMDPAIGASTWALGSQRCRPYRGAFTMKAVSRAMFKKRVDQWFVDEGGRRWGVSFRVGRCRVPICECRYRIATSRGRELMSV